MGRKKRCSMSLLEIKTHRSNHMKQLINQAYIQQASIYLENTDGKRVLAAPIPNVHGYWAAVDGSIFSLKRNKIRQLKPADNGNGYLFVILSMDGISQKHYVSRLVASTFLVQPIEPDADCNTRDEVNHSDGNRRNNKPPNLEWCSSAENHAHSKLVLRSADFLASKFAASYLVSKQA